MCMNLFSPELETLPLYKQTLHIKCGLADGNIWVFTHALNDIENFWTTGKLDLSSTTIKALGYLPGLRLLEEKIIPEGYQVALRTPMLFMAKHLGYTHFAESENIFLDTHPSTSDLLPLVSDYLGSIRQHSPLICEARDNLETMAKKTTNWALDRQVFVLKKDTYPVAMAISDYRHQDMSWLFNCGTKKELRGQGYFKKLFSHVENHLFTSGVRQLGLFCREGYREQVYQRLGFESISNWQQCEFTKILSCARLTTED